MKGKLNDAPVWALGTMSGTSLDGVDLAVGAGGGGATAAGSVSALKLVALTGGSNVTGFMPDVHKVARMAHEHGALILLDCAQLLAHDAIDIKLEIPSARDLEPLSSLPEQSQSQQAVRDQAGRINF